MPFDAVSPDSLQSSPAVLVLDIRPYPAYSSSRIINALPFAAPSTLLKRPRFPLSRLQTNLSESARIRFSAWPEAPQIIVYDADSTSIPDSCNIQGLLRKFSLEGFRGRLSWLEGGFQAVCRDRPDLVDTSPPSPQSEQPLEEACPTLCTSQLPISAFSLASTTASASSAPAPAQKDGALTVTSVSARVFSGALLTHTNPYPACNSFFDTIHQNIELTHGITDRIPLRLPSRVRRRITDLPFKWLRDIAHRAAPLDAEEDAGVDPADVAEGAEALAMQFYRIELAEQRRMMGVMEHHSKQSRQLVDTTDDPAEIGSCYPFSITAGVEKGAKNRYLHIWPFEHARVRLHSKPQDAVNEDDYINASFVQPLGTNKRYIATQGPLPATFTDFWTLCWEQNVHVIVMLTKEVEGSLVKCGKYWKSGPYGPLTLQLISSSASSACEDEEPSSSAESPFILRPEPAEKEASKVTIKRVFELRHSGFPKAGARRVVHLQYLEWPDMNVPENPQGVLGLVKEVEQAYAEAGSGDDHLEGGAMEVRDEMVGLSLAARAESPIDEETGVARHAMGKGRSPVLLHCSAGVGRTGGFIAVDAILDAVRREMRLRKMDGMDVDMDVEDEVDSEWMSSTARTPRAELKPRWPSASSESSSSPSKPSNSESDNSLWSRPASNSTSASSFMEQPVLISPPARKKHHHRPSTPIKDRRRGIVKARPLSAPNALSHKTRPTAPEHHSAPTLAAAGHSPYSYKSSPLRSMEKPGLRTVSAPMMNDWSSSMESSLSLADSMTSTSSLVSCAADSGRKSPSISTALTSDSSRPPSPTEPTTDFVQPRPLHTREPILLSELEEPVWEVVQAMREQRMSLCQSLRQYVFVHLAVVEGVLMAVDEEREAAAATAAVTAPATLPGKRGASPTELSAEDRAARMCKRPSFTRTSSQIAVIATRL